ncbi:kinesin-like protein KIN-7O isoform X2 [Syzygium oleosum]|uniref:kinesin-like protein KIN-7O isoform X2 n=1 Tax=Syzygium oleosum TaxID=219896 RepID=UPI0024BA0B77|nr:kinesin-like protein KIN-7O isoform X2 [Syzygium oleosum]
MQGIHLQEVDLEFSLRMSYMEIYNEEIHDLLAPEHRKLQIHENPERGIYVADLREEKVKSSDEVLNLMQFGEAHRHNGKTNMNVCSSRSHTIFRMLIEIRDKTGKSSDAVRISVLNLVDLAGWERAAKTEVEGIRLKEGCHINKSLMTLRTVIKKLSAGAESQGGHVPFRDSKLTRILQPALGGNSNTAIICNITLAQSHADETKSSLKFASRALRIKSCAHVNEILTDAVLLKRQQKEIEELKAKLQGSHSEHSEKILNLQNALHQSELERERITLELEVEKKAQAECERHLQEQAKKIENLSSIVLYSNREDNRHNFEKCRRRHTWCPGNLSRETLVEAYSLPNILRQEKEQDDGFAAFSAGRRGLDASGGAAKNTLGAATAVAPDVLSLPMKEMLLEKDERREVGKTYGGSKFAVIREYLEIFNTGSREELMGIMRIGEKKATEIIEYREQNHKPFRELKDLESLHISTKLVCPVFPSPFCPKIEHIDKKEIDCTNWLFTSQIKKLLGIR